MALYLDGECDQCGRRSNLVVGGGPEPNIRETGDVVVLCVACLRGSHEDGEVLDMIERGRIGIGRERG